jgi:hypothetical protein
MSNLTSTITRGPQFKPLYWRPQLRFIEGGEGGNGEGGDGGGEGGKQEQATLTQADVDRIVKERVSREKAKYADYDDLKAKAEGAKTVEQKLADLEGKYSAAEARALRSDIAAKHGISAEDRDLFLTGTDESTLTAQAKRLADREADRKKQGNQARNEGKSTPQKVDDERAAVRTLFGGGEG